MLQPDPTQADRLDAIITSLGERIVEARERGWHGDVEGLEVSLSAARDKRQPTAISQLAAQHDEVQRLRTTVASHANIIALPISRKRP